MKYFQLFKINVSHLLQIDEILKYFSCTPSKSLCMDWDVFLKHTIWILENLEQNNSKPASFLLATVYINVCNKMCKVDKT